MAKTYLSIILFALATLSVLAKDSKIISQSQGSITFEVDENLLPIDHEFNLLDGGQIAERLFADYKYKDLISEYSIIATSFANEHNLEYQGEGPFYATLITAYANHKSVTLSPDMVWLLICQGFARYVNEHGEELRPLLVSHTGKMTLTVKTDKELLTQDAEWPKLISDFASQIDQFTKGDIAHVITADFSTTGPVERVASQITLMESVKHYFDYEVVLICGIPSITLKGTPEDWQRVLEKTKKLSQYGLDEWVKDLEPILTEFIRASEGHPDQKFWQSIVRKIRADEIKGSGSGGCGDESEPTMFDGWFLKLYPNWDGKTCEIATMEALEAERVLVEFLYKIEDEAGNTLVESTMELWAGFIGTEVDTAANMLTPRIGWMVLKGPTVFSGKSMAFLDVIKKHWALCLCLTALVISIFAFLGWKVIKSRRKAK